MDITDIMQQLFIRYQLSAEDHGWDWEDPEDLRHKFENWAQTELMLFCDDDADFESAFKMGGKFDIVEE